MKVCSLFYHILTWKIASDRKLGLFLASRFHDQTEKMRLGTGPEKNETRDWKKMRLGIRTGPGLKTHPVSEDCFYAASSF